MVNRHVFLANRCIYCNTEEYDDAIYGPFECIDREGLTYTTETKE